MGGPAPTPRLSVANPVAFGPKLHVFFRIGRGAYEEGTSPSHLLLVPQNSELLHSFRDAAGEYLWSYTGRHVVVLR